MRGQKTEVPTDKACHC